MEVKTIGVDQAKSLLQLHGVEGKGRPSLRAGSSLRGLRSERPPGADAEGSLAGKKYRGFTIDRVVAQFDRSRRAEKGEERESGRRGALAPG